MNALAEVAVAAAETERERRASLDERSRWRPASVVARESAAEDMVALALRPEQWIPHRAGQYYDLRFPGETLSRAYSVVSPPGVRDRLEFGIQTLPRGFLSRRFAACHPGDRLEIRGPIGAAFTWDHPERGALVLLGAGAGITPLLSMYDHARAERPGMPLLFLVSARTPERVFRYERYRDAMITRFTVREPRIDRAWLARMLEPVLAGPATPTGRADSAPAGRADSASAAPATPATSVAPTTYDQVQVRVCGPLGFIDARVDDLLALGIAPESIRSEAFV